ncbi:altronate dehydratase family protein [Tersicoccus sp. MR15.9]|uniref:UxaA family hydrolase n=1 Tax=Tersicoccus mangrovi TaxID=3121635 RepID=UPI002FE6B4A5
MTGRVLSLGRDDDVVIALDGAGAGETVDVDGAALPANGDIPRGHKIALRDIPAGGLVHKYGHVIGEATADIHRGDHVHTHNLGMPADPTALASSDTTHAAAAVLPPDLPRTFAGIRRSDGRIATRNFIAVLSTVNCSATVAQQIARRSEIPLESWRERGIDGVIALTHGTGCGMAASGEGWDVLRRTMRGYAEHPNIGGVVVVGLGCEVNAIAGLIDPAELRTDVPISSYTIQGVGGTRAAIDNGVEAVLAMAEQIADVERTEVGVENLVLGMQCGGSDALSAITANPALGVVSDWLVAQGAISVLGETPEIYGAEQMLADRAVSPEVAARLLERIAWWEKYAEREGATLDGNPSPGNKEGGISTILEKSLGSVAKGGHAPLTAVHAYAERTDVPGFVFMDSPGYDPVSATGMVAGGANLICFTTGRGSAFGSRPAPTVKLATNRELAIRMAGDMDVDCSGVVEEGRPLEDVAREIYAELLAVASGKQSKSEELGMGGEEFVPWQIGAVL